MAIFLLPKVKECSDKWTVPWVNIKKRPIFLKPRCSKCEPFNSRKHGSTLSPQLIVKRTLDATTGSLCQRGEHLHSGLLICRVKYYTNFLKCISFPMEGSIYLLVLVQVNSLDFFPYIWRETYFLRIKICVGTLP